MDIENKGLEIRLYGIVQGVGFRPFIVQLAQRFKIKGQAWNTTQGVTIHCVAPKQAIDGFLKAILESPPPLARIDACETSPIIPHTIPESFEILPSKALMNKETLVAPDTAICALCKQECLNPTNRRYRYPFITCTNCGPRWSIVNTTPYDRQNTSMHKFPMCHECQKEYEDLADRRFHAQPISCHNCGPSLTLLNAQGQILLSATPGKDSLADTQKILKKAGTLLTTGHILAIKGIGGFHLAVNAHSFEAVKRLRERKRRPYKPLAIMVRDLDTANRLCVMDDTGEKALTGPIQPIVCLKKRTPFPLPENLSPNLDEIGVMLPYTPLHLLLFEAMPTVDALIMTSANRTGSPICTDNEDALKKLQGIADYFLIHDRDIVSRLDDSVCRIVNNQMSQVIRRSRGYVPDYIKLKETTIPTLACGAELKNTFCLARRDKAFLSPHIGDLNSLETMEFFETTLKHMKELFSIEPEQVVCDLHPNYLSTHYAKDTKLPLIQVQHHHAHIAAVMAEHQIDQEVLGIALDGIGLGPDGTLWGGEILLCTPTQYKRLAHLPYLPMPGGDMATREPWRVALSAAYQIWGNEAMGFLPKHFTQIPQARMELVLQLLETSTNTPSTSSCGRLFDAISALLGICLISTYEGQAAMELESLAQHASITVEEAIIQTYPLEITRDIQNNCLSFSSNPLIQGVLGDLINGLSPADIAIRFHAWLIYAIIRAIQDIVSRIDKRPVVLAGGSMQNRILLTHLMRNMEKMGLITYTARAIPVNDGGISLGQAFIATHLTKSLIYNEDENQWKTE